MKPYRILVVDDSAFMRKIITDLIEIDPRLKVQGTAHNGQDALKRIAELSPDLVTMDVEMPVMNGLEALKHIMSASSIPVVMLSGINEEGMRETIMALELGAFDFIRKPSAATSSHGIEELGSTLREQIITAMEAEERRKSRLTAEAIIKKNQQLSAGVGTVRPIPEKAPESRRTKAEPIYSIDPGIAKNSQKKTKSILQVTGTELDPARLTRNNTCRPQADSNGAQLKNSNKIVPEPKLLIKSARDFTDIVAIGCSTGGPKALKTVLEQIPADFPAPILIVQHMPPNFTHSLAVRLNSLSEVKVIEASDGLILERSTAYIAPGGYHLVVQSCSEGYKVFLNKEALRNGHRPSVDVMYESLLPLALRRHAVLLTGMGSDGAKMMKCLYESGVESTFAESEETCVVYGMPRSAVELNCVNYILPLYDIASKLVQVVK